MSQKLPVASAGFGAIGLIAVVIVILLLGLAGWFLYPKLSSPSKEVEAPKQLHKGKITIGYVLWPGYVGLFVARDKGFFKEAGLDVELKSYPSLTESYEDYKSGKIQGVANLAIDVVNGAYKGLDNKIVVAVDYSDGSDGIIASKDIKEIKDIKGKKVAFEKDTLEEFFLRFALEKNRLKITDITPIYLNPEESAQALVKKRADVAVTYEPFMSKALSESGGNKIYSSKEAPGLITDTITFRTDFINDHPDTVQAIIEVYLKAIKFWKDNPDEANAILAKELGVTKEEAVEQLAGVNILDVQDNKVAFTYGESLQSLYGNLKELSTFVLNQQQSSPIMINSNLLIEPRFINNLSN